MILMHVACLGVFVTGVSKVALVATLLTYLFHVFALTAGYHRYFSHRSFKTSRAFQFALALAGATATQMDPLWWAAHHRWHHRHADTEQDVHSPTLRGFWYAHIGWILSRRHAQTRFDVIKDLVKYPELMWLNRHPYLPSVIFAALLYGVGSLLARVRPGWNTSGMQMLVWAYFVSTVLVYHVTFAVNSVAHLFGTRPYPTRDTSRNSVWVALVTLGEGWHNNHHRYPASARQGFRWWQIDGTYYLLKLLSWFRVVRDLREPPAAVLEEART